MGIIVHHKPVNLAVSWNMRVWQTAWDGNNVWDTRGITSGDVVEFQLPETPDARKLQFKFHSTAPDTGLQSWEPDDATRRLFLAAAPEIWSFEASPRVLYQNPFPAGILFNPGEVLTFQVITQSAFRGGQLFVWNPYDPGAGPAYFGESSRDDATGVSSFRVTLAPWMTTGFHLKLLQPGCNNGPAFWEPDASNRVWRPCDGASLWLKSGQCDLRREPLALTPVALELLYGANLAAPPQLSLTDLVERTAFPLTGSSSRQYEGSPLFRVASYSVPIYPEASYSVSCETSLENPPLQRPFPADPAALDTVSRCILGAGGWVERFPAIQSIPVSIKPQAASSFRNGVSVQVSLGNGPGYQTVAAALQPDGSWQAGLDLAIDTTTAIDLFPAAGAEPKPYPWIDTSRYCTPAADTQCLYTTEGVYGVCARGATRFAEPPDRAALMRAVFGGALVEAGIFAARELPQGASIIGDQVYFVLHAPHAVQAALVLVEEGAAGPARREFPMALTGDTFYWWCALPLSQAAAGTRYRFLLNDRTEVMDPAARAVLDTGSLKTCFGADPADAGTSWSVVLDVAAVSAAAHRQPWQTMGWQNFLIYEIHARRFSNLDPGPLSSFDLLADELNPTSRLGQPGYLNRLPATVLGLMPVNEFSSAVSWGYDPSYYFAIDEYYGGAAALARLVDAAHANGRGVTLDLVYNHSLGSSLMKIAPDVYRNGDYDGDRMNCGHPMVREYFRQACVYLFRTYNLDGFRFDDTQTIVTKCQGGWEFLSMIRASLRAAASAEGRSWPYCVAENSATTAWDVSDPATGVMDGQWGIDEVFQIRAASYDSAHPGWDDSAGLKAEMDQPQSWGRPFFQATRFGESHDMVSGQDSLNLRIAARPPFGQGYQMAKALGALTALSNGVPMLFMGQEVGETVAFSFDDTTKFVNPQEHDLPPSAATDNTRILSWFRQLLGLRNDPSKGLQGDANFQVVATGNRTVAFSCGSDQRLFTVVSFGTPDRRQDSSWLGLPGGAPYKEIFNSSWPDFQVEFEPEQGNGGYQAQIYRGEILNLPWIGAVVLERC